MNDPIKIKVYVLCSRVGTELFEPSVHPNYELAYKEMETCFNSSLKDHDSYAEETEISNDRAIIVSNDDYEEWTITECELSLTEPLATAIPHAAAYERSAACE